MILSLFSVLKVRNKDILEYTDMKYVEEANEILNLAKFLNFTDLYNAVGAALATNFYVGDD